MKLREKLLAAFQVAAARFVNLKRPFFVNWVLTNRCNFKCKYCVIWNITSEELDTAQAFSVIDKLSGCGTKFIAFSGGEPLLRDDFPEIVNHCFKKGIYTKLTTNGSLLAEKIAAIGNLSEVRLSFDGPKEVHDLHRQEGSFEQVVNSVELLKKHNIRAVLNCVISRLNIDCIGYVLEKARELDVRVTFQPLESRSNRDFISQNMPAEGKYKKFIRGLIAEKKNGNRHIANSLPALEYLYNWPLHKKIKCMAGQFFCRITADGSVIACDRQRVADNSFSCLAKDMRSKFKGLTAVNCPGGCWRNPTIELNYLLSFNMLSVMNFIDNFCHENKK